MVSTEELKSVGENARKRYGKRYDELGRNIRTLGWGSEEQQTYRFEHTLSAEVNWNTISVLDIGCGFGDYCHFLQTRHIEFTRYTGWDITPAFVDEASTKFAPDTRCEFACCDIGALEKSEPVADFGVMLGLLNWKLESPENNYAYSFGLISRAFESVNQCLVVDFLSDRLTPEYPREDLVFYHDSIQMLDFAFSLTPNVVLKHNYAPIPQKEFMLMLYK